jgi:hypothetical protein
MEDQEIRRPKGSTFRVYVATSLDHATFGEIEHLGKEFNLRKAEVLRALCLRGLRAYHNDGILIEGGHLSLIKVFAPSELDK